MPTIHPKTGRFLLFVAIGVTVCLGLGVVTAGGPWPDGEVYRFYASGLMPWWNSGEVRTFGGPPTQLSWVSPFWGGLSGAFWDSSDTMGLPADRVRLLFHRSHQGSGSGQVVLRVTDFTIPSGATYLEDTARITFYWPGGSGPFTIGPTYKGSGIFYVSGDMSLHFGAPNYSGYFTADSVTYEIVVDNVPEPLTIGLFAAGTLGLIGRAIARSRSRAQAV